MTLARLVRVAGLSYLIEPGCSETRSGLYVVKEVET